MDFLDMDLCKILREQKIVVDVMLWPERCTIQLHDISSGVSYYIIGSRQEGKTVQEALYKSVHNAFPHIRAETQRILKERLWEYDAVKRGTGETTRQIQSAPENALYVWTTCDFRYPRKLAHHLGRDDLTFYPPSALYDMDYLARKYIGTRVSAIIVDHGVPMTRRMWDTYTILQDLLVR